METQSLGNNIARSKKEIYRFQNTTRTPFCLACELCVYPKVAAITLSLSGMAELGNISSLVF